MILRTLAVGAAIAVTLFTLPALGAEQPRLKAQATVHGPLVTLGDLIEGAGEAAGAAVFRAPEPGMAGTVRADRIAAAAAGHGLSDLDTGGIDSVSVSRLGRAVDAGEIAQAIGRRLAASGGTRIEDVDIDLDRLDRPFVVEHAAVAPVSIEAFDHDPRTGRFAAIVKVADSRAAAAGIRVTGRAVEIVEVPVLARTVERGEIITPHDIVIERLPRGALDAGAITDAGRLAGMSARRQLREGMALTGDLVTEPILVQRGDLVTIAYNAPGLALTIRGRALSAGARGEVIQVFNAQSRRTVEAEVNGPGFVTVMPQRVPVAGLPTTVR